MHIFSEIRLSLIYQAFVWETFCTLIICYVLAVTKGHACAWLPMISRCAVCPPEKYIFRIGIVLTSVGILFQVFTAYNTNLKYSKSSLCLFLGTLAGVSLSIVGVVNEDEDHLVHACELFTHI